MRKEASRRFGDNLQTAGHRVKSPPVSLESFRREPANEFSGKPDIVTNIE
jgi:hypothetical protein